MYASSSICQRSTLGVQRIRARREVGTTSSQTVCQMPVVRGYQMECGSSCQSCLPRGLERSRGSSYARTVIVCGRLDKTESVISTKKGVYPPSCVVAGKSLIQTVAR